MKTSILTIALILSSLSGCRGHYITANIENDSFSYGPPTDANYTNGILITATRSHDPCSNEQCDNQPLGNIIDGLNIFEPSNEEYESGNAQSLVTYGIGQEFWTPDDISDPEIIHDDRPYGGFLNAVLEINNQHISGIAMGDWAEDKMRSIKVRVGVIGPYSFAEDVQTIWHEVCACTTPEGWDNQLRSEIGITYSIRQDNRHFPVALKSSSAPIFDVVSFGEITLGNVYSGIDLGGALRFGHNLPREFMPDTQLPVLTALDSNPITNPRVSSDAGFYLYGFIGMEGRLVARDIFLDGNTFRDSPHEVDKEYFVNELAFGGVIGWRSYEVTIAFVRRSDQFRSQEKDHRFGQIKIRFPIKFN